jgi:hypothetical protein
MIGQLTGKEYTELLQEEGADIDKARAEGLVQDFFMKADRSGPVLILADVSADQARERMAGLPFIVHDIATFDYIEMVPPPAGPTTNQ